QIPVCRALLNSSNTRSAGLFFVSATKLCLPIDLKGAQAILRAEIPLLSADKTPCPIFFGQGVSIILRFNLTVFLSFQKIRG
ncbi:MAG: hypothetical protein IKQ18_01665, partial [Clostridia bacterium]|nr:hypothetical protein [Clostridia bacterium]